MWLFGVGEWGRVGGSCGGWDERDGTGAEASE